MLKKMGSLKDSLHSQTHNGHNNDPRSLKTWGKNGVKKKVPQLAM